MTIMLDTGATRSFICSRLAAVAALGPNLGQPGPLAASVTTAVASGTLGLGAPVLLHSSLGNMFRESMCISPMDVGDDLILGSGWDWISSHWHAGDLPA
jgi:hypothetical protein